MPVLLRPVNNFLGQVIGNASEGKYNTGNNYSSGEVTFQKCLKSGITIFSSKNSNKSQTFATGAYQRLHEARPRRVVWLWEPEYMFHGWELRWTPGPMPLWHRLWNELPLEISSAKTLIDFREKWKPNFLSGFSDLAHRWSGWSWRQLCCAKPKGSICLLHKALSRLWARITEDLDPV